MIDNLSATSIQQSALTDNTYKAIDIVRKLERGQASSDVKDQAEDNKKVAKEMESLFAYQLLKVMRETNSSMSEDEKENGYDAYMSLFDVEVSKLIADRGLGLQDAIISWLERSQGVDSKIINSKE
ncbi:MAG: hypothetical protein C4581_12755 [Nitrospiraceae bacterium]|nr:MAG: hypothetical protein C4581_12755 [Nitrospiraceae bacterium]